MIPIILIYLLRFCTGQMQMPELNYVVIIDSQMEGCDDESLLYVDTSEMMVGRYNETAALMTGDIKLLQDVGEDNIMVEIILKREACGKYEIVCTHEIYDFCGEVAKGADSDYYPYIKYLPKSCPFKADSYPVEDFLLHTDDFPLNSNTAGKYQASLTAYKNPEDLRAEKEFIFCVTMKLLIEQD